MADREVRFQGDALRSMAFDLQPVPNWIGFTYTSSLNRTVKVLDFVQLGGPILTVDRTIFEMWLGDCKSTEAADPSIAA